MVSGILKNKLADEDKQNIKLAESTKEFREQVLKNTKLNALLKKDFDISTLNDEELEQIINTSDLTTEEKERLKWNKKNLSDNAVLQKQILENLTQTIDEPKTPFQKAANPELNEYYQDDNEDDLDDFSLGEPEFKPEVLDKLDSTLKSNVIVDDDNEEEKPKKSFAELRKQHYHNEHVHISPKEENIEDQEEENGDDENDEEEEEDEEEPPKPKKSFAELRKEHYAHEHPPIRKSYDEDIDVDDEE